MQYPRIIDASAIDDHTLVVRFSNQVVKQYSIQQLAENPMFALLQQPAFAFACKKLCKIEGDGLAATPLFGTKRSTLVSTSYGKMAQP